MMPSKPAGPARLPPVQRPVAPPAPWLTKSWRCSDCNEPSVLIAGGDLRVCTRCHALLWHADWSAEARAARARAAEAAAEAKAEAVRLKHEAFLTRKAKKHNAAFDPPPGLELSAPEIGAPTLTENPHDEEKEVDAQGLSREGPRSQSCGDVS